MWDASMDGTQGMMPTLKPSLDEYTQTNRKVADMIQTMNIVPTQVLIFSAAKQNLRMAFGLLNLRHIPALVFFSRHVNS